MRFFVEYAPLLFFLLLGLLYIFIVGKTPMTSHTPHNEEKDDWEKKLLGEVLYEGRLVRRHVDASRAWVKNKLAPLVYDVIRQERQRLLDEVEQNILPKHWRPDWIEPAESEEEEGYRKGLVAEHNLQAKELREKLQALR